MPMPSVKIQHTNDARNSSDELQTTVVRRSQRKTGRNPVNLPGIDEECPETQCGLAACSIPVIEGVKCIECNFCSSWFHRECSNLTEVEFENHVSDSDLLWFCEACLKVPVVVCLTSLIRKQAKVIQSLETLLKLNTARDQAPTLVQVSTHTSQQGLSANIDEFPPVTSSVVPSRGRTQTTNVRNSNSSFETINRGGSSPMRIPSISPTKKTLGKDADALTIICTNVPESKALSLKQRQLDDKTEWALICKLMNISVDLDSITRLSRSRQSPHIDKPRLLRVTLNSVSDVEEVLLSSSRLRHTSSEVRIFPDVPWEQRQKQKNNPEETKKQNDKKVILIQGVPELAEQESASRHEHDCMEWRFIQELLGVKGTLTTAVCRIPFAPTYKGTGPRILKVSFLTEQMVTTALQAWYDSKRIAPPELRLRAATDPYRKRTFGFEENTGTSGDQQAETDSINESSPPKKSGQLEITTSTTSIADIPKNDL